MINGANLFNEFHQTPAMIMKAFNEQQFLRSWLKFMYGTKLCMAQNLIT